MRSVAVLWVVLQVGAMVREAVDERVEMVKSDLNRGCGSCKQVANRAGRLCLFHLEWGAVGLILIC